MAELESKVCCSMDADLDLNLRDHHDNVHTTPMMTTTANKQNYRIFTSLNFRSILNSDYNDFVVLNV